LRGNYLTDDPGQFSPQDKDLSLGSGHPKYIWSVEGSLIKYTPLNRQTGQTTGLGPSVLDLITVTLLIVR
jgi:hypothetical protein